MLYTEHFASCLEKYPECRTYLERVCAAWSRYKRLPQRIVLRLQCSAVPVEIAMLFGVASLHLTRGNVLCLIPQHLFSTGSEQEINDWIQAVHISCGMVFKPATKVKAACPIDTISQRWSLMFPDLAPLLPYLKYSSLSGQVDKTKIPAQWVVAGQIVQFLKGNQESLTVSDLGGRFCHDSKALRTGELIGMVADWLTVLDFGIDGFSFPSDNRLRRIMRAETLSRHGIVENRGAITVIVYGSLVYTKDDKKFTLIADAAIQGEAAVLTLENLDRISAFHASPTSAIITCENESPFFNLVRQRHQALILYTKGFPNGAVKTLYRCLAEAFPGLPRLHWGDTDFAGLQIAAMLHTIAPLSLWRCDLASLQQHVASLLPLDQNQSLVCRSFLDRNPQFPFFKELEFTLKNGWLEQEQYSGNEKNQAMNV
ncbi:MAG: DUF2399 domain-containing protein [Chitinivibrionales bacterium]|nr:DUF2399 domain-containing protein [Chitinivibrionales bacterium]